MNFGLLDKLGEGLGVWLGEVMVGNDLFLNDFAYCAILFTNPCSIGSVIMIY